MNYDLIGDIHGHSGPLIELLDKLEYRLSGGVYRHPERKVIYLGDFIDRGPNQREVIGIVRPMIDADAALSVMGNHEFNAIAYSTPDPLDPSRHLRVHNEKHQRQHQAFLDAYKGHEYQELIQWFRNLPMWLDLPGLRVVHACWDRASMQTLPGEYAQRQYLDDELLASASRKGSTEFDAVETLLKGKEVELPGDATFLDRDGNLRQDIRIRWWDAAAHSYREAFIGPDSSRKQIPEDPIGSGHAVDYPCEDPPVFIGHYWLDAEPRLMAPKIACLDYGIAARGGGKLVAYRWDGEQELRNDKFVYVGK